MSRPIGTRLKRRVTVKRAEVTQPADQSIRYIPLTRGKFAIVDAADYEWLSHWNWFAHKAKSGLFYASRNVRVNGKFRTVKMHQVICENQGDQWRDHKNGNGLDNRRDNLRPATVAENNRNRKIQRNNRSGFHGVSWRTCETCWSANIRVNGRLLHLGKFENPEEAARAYDAAAIKHFGEFARLNFPPQAA